VLCGPARWCHSHEADLATLDDPTRFHDGRQKRLEIGQTIRHRRYDHHTDVVTSQVLLILKILIGREEDVELSGSDGK